MLKTLGNTYRSKRSGSGFKSRCKACTVVEKREEYYREYNKTRVYVPVESKYRYPYKNQRPCRFSGCDRITTSKSGYCQWCRDRMVDPIREERRIVYNRKASLVVAAKLREERLSVAKRCLGCGGVLNSVRAKGQDYCKSCYPKRACKIAYCSDCGGAMRPDVTRRCRECMVTLKERRKERYAVADAVRRKAEVSITTKYKRKLKSGGCVICSYNRDLNALEFHHLFGKKGKGLSKINHIVSVNKEIERNPVVILCANCHRELHSGLVDDGRLVRYRLQPHRVQVGLFKRKASQTGKKGK